MLETILLSITAFVGTNMDDLFIDMLFFSEARTVPETRAVFIGKYLGIGALIVLSLLGAAGLHLLPQEYIGLLGIVPIALGVKEIIENRRPEQEEQNAASHPSGSRALHIALITVANGADNIGVYIPLFGGFSGLQTGVCVLLFLLMTGLWCLFGKTLASMPVLHTLLTKHKKIIVPAVLIMLGVYILMENFM